MQKYPWSTKQLRRLGDSVRDDQPIADNSPAYADVMAYFNDYADEIRQSIYNLDWSNLLEDRPFEVTARPKTIDTLRQKLQRDRSTPLPSIQDIAGVRFEAEMTLVEQDAVASALMGLFEESGEVSLRDMRNDPHSGYRAVHIWIRTPARAEVQIRTHLQGKWANMYESAADVLGREIRYGVLPENEAERKLVVFLHLISRVIAEHEVSNAIFSHINLRIYPRPPLVKRYARMRKSDVRRMNQQNNQYRNHELRRLILKGTELRIASDCESIKEQFEKLLTTRAEMKWRDS